MTIPKFVYDSQFNKAELEEIGRLRSLDRLRAQLAFAAGAATVLTIFLIQMPFRGIDVIHAVCTYGCIPPGVAVGGSVYFFLNRYVSRAFTEKWDRLFLQRSGTTEPRLEAQQEVLALTETGHFLVLPLDEQRKRVNEVYRKHGLSEPNKD